MSRNVPPTKQTLIRLPTIKTGLLEGLTRDEIGEKCGVTEKTIDRDITAWINSGLFEQWLKEEFVRLHPTMVKAYPEIVYKELARLIGKMVTQKAEIKSEHTERKIIFQYVGWKSPDANSGSET